MVNFRLVGRGRKKQNDADLMEGTSTLSPEGVPEAMEEQQGLLLSSGGDVVPCTTLVPYDPNSLPQLSSTLQTNNEEGNYESAVVKEEEEESSDDNDSDEEDDDSSSNDNDSNSDDDDDDDDEEEEEDLTNVVEVDEENEDSDDDDRAQYKDDYYGGDPRSAGANGGGGRDAYLTWSFKRRFGNKEYDLQPQPPLALQASGSDDDDDDYDNNELLLEDWGNKSKGYDGVYTRNEDDDAYDDYDEEKYYEDADEGAALVKKSADSPARRRRMWGQSQAQDDERKVNSFSYGEFSPSRGNNRYDMGRSNGGSTPNLNNNDNRRRMNRSIPGLVCGVAVGVVGGVSAAAQAVSNRQNRRRLAEAIKIQAASVMAGAEGTSKRHFGNSADDADYDDDHAPLVCDDDGGNGNRYGYNRRNDNYDDDDDAEGETRGLLGFGGKKKTYQGHTCYPPPLRGNELGEYALAGQEVRGYNDPEEQDGSHEPSSTIIQRQRDKIEYLTQKIVHLEYELSQMKASSSTTQGKKHQQQEEEADSRSNSSSHSSAEEEGDSDDDEEVKCETLLDIYGNNEDRIGLLDYHNLENDSNDDDDDDHVLLPLKDVIAQEEDDLFFKDSSKFEFVEETTISTTADFATTATALTTTTTTNDKFFSFSSNNVKEISETDAFDGLVLFPNDEGDNEVEITEKTSEVLASQEEEIDDETVEIDNEETKEPSFVGLLSKDQVERYSRHLLMKDGIGGVKGQVELNQSSVLVIGAGGIGSTVLMYLASSGIGHIGVVDFDNVETSNLHRQIIHSQNRVGMNKAKSAVQTMKQLNPTINCEVIDEIFTHHNALEMIQHYDCVVDASDNPQTRYLINDACILSKKPLVSGSAIGTEGQLTVYDHSSKSTNAPCYRCMYPNPPPSQNCQGCSDSGVLGPVPGIIGILQAIEVIKLLTRQHVVTAVGEEGKTAASARTTMHDRILMYDSIRCTFMSIKKPPRRKNCISCGYKGNDSSSLKTMEDSYNLIKDTRGPNHSNIVATSSDDNDTKQEGTVAEPSDATTTLPTTPSSSCTVSLLPPALSISCQEYYKLYYCNKNRLQNKMKQHILLDVRVKEQYEMCSLKGSINIPLEELGRHLDKILSQVLLLRSNDDESSLTVSLTTPSSSSLLPLNELQKMKKDQGVDHDAPSTITKAEQQQQHVTIFCICRRGIASREATLQLHLLITEKGFCGGSSSKIDVKNITGGLNAWHNEVDSNFPFY